MPAVEQTAPVALEDNRYRAVNFNESRIEFAEPAWMFGETVCFGELLNVEWFASVNIADVIVGIYQPGFSEEDVKTIGAFRGTNNPEWIPGYGTFIWNVGVLQDGAQLRPGSGYRFVVQDADGDTRKESNSFSIAQCQ